MNAADRRRLALAIARRDGAVFAGTTVERGAVIRFTRRDLELLRAEGLVVTRVSPDGKMMAIATTEEGRPMERTAKQIAAAHAEADARVGGKCGCAACCIERYGMTRTEHLTYRTTGKWPRRVRRPV